MTYNKKYRIKKKEIQPNYIRFELNNNIEFSNGNHNFIFCVNEHPFKNYRVGDEIEVNLTNAKYMNSQSYHQGLVRKVVENMPEDIIIGDYSSQSEENEKSRGISTQKSITLSAHDKILVFDNLRYLLEGVEEYIEKAGYYPN